MEISLPIASLHSSISWIEILIVVETEMMKLIIWRRSRKADKQVNIIIFWIILAKLYSKARTTSKLTSTISINTSPIRIVTAIDLSSIFNLYSTHKLQPTRFFLESNTPTITAGSMIQVEYQNKDRKGQEMSIHQHMKIREIC